MLEGKNIEAVIEETGQIVACTSGLSMYPMLRNRKDTVVIEKAKGRLMLHDVPLYRLSTGKLVLHRIIKVTPDGYVIRGDNLYKSEYGVTDNNIIGVLKSFYRGKRQYDCNKSRSYKLYVLYIRISYPVRYVLFGLIRPAGGRLWHFLSKKSVRK